MDLDISTQHCLIESDGGIMTVTLNRPEAKNALSSQMIIGMYRAWRRLDEDDSLICAILTGNGDTFCAGMDLKEGAKGHKSSEEMDKLMAEVPDLHWQSLLRQNRPTKPIILAVEGYAVAGGTEILQGTDIRVAAEDAIFGITEVKRGLYPVGGSSVRLRRQIPYALAAEMLLLGRHITAQEAQNFGLINRVVEKGKTLEEARKIAIELGENGPLALKALVKTLREVDESYSEEQALARELEIGWPIFATEDAKEGMTAFAEKRKPNYKGK